MAVATDVSDTTITFDVSHPLVGKVSTLETELVEMK